MRGKVGSAQKKKILDFGSVTLYELCEYELLRTPLNEFKTHALKIISGPFASLNIRLQCCDGCYTSRLLARKNNRYDLHLFFWPSLPKRDWVRISVD